MFKLESYVTPLLLSYVNKYIKNLKPEDSQVSLWGGDAVFNNLDLRLEVLEQELQLPFTFINGHIHELRIHVPWTKLGSEPIIITINTIECILKLKEANDGDSSDSSKLGGKSDKKKSRRIEVEDVPPSYVQSLVNRITSNISIICNNLILKYVEDDIVLSLNVKSAELCSANEQWEKAFVDLTLPDLVLRKLINLQDLTVCLDQRNASGKIDAYQDPVLYRCSLECRLYIAYDSITAKTSAVTRLDVLCDKLEFSITDQQLPMFFRLLQLCLALYSGELDGGRVTSGEKRSSISAVSVHEDSYEEGKLDLFSNDENPESWGSWAWSFVPQIIPVWEDEEDGDEGRGPKPPPAVLHVGVYVNTASFVFKLTESSSRLNQKLAFQPFACLYQEGLYMEAVMRNPDCVNCQMGVQSIRLASLGDCICSDSEVSSSCYTGSDPVFFVSGQQLANDTMHNYLSSSIFSIQSPENKGQRREYHYEWDDHFSEFSERNMLDRSPAFAFDFFYFLELSEHNASDKSSTSLSDMENSNLKERTMVRFMLGPFEMNVTGAFVHRYEKFFFCSKSREYEPYTQVRDEVVDDNIPTPPSQEELKILEEFIPYQMYIMTMVQPVVKLYAADHPKCDTATRRLSSKKKRRVTVPSIEMNSTMSSLPAIVVYASRIETEHTKALYPRRIVKIANIVHPTREIFLHNSHIHMTLKVFGCEINLQIPTPDQDHQVNIIPACSNTFYVKQLMLPSLWKNPFQPKMEYYFEMAKLSIRLTWSQLLFVWNIYASWMQKKPDLHMFSQTSLLKDALNLNKDQQILEVAMTGIDWKISETDTVIAHIGWIETVKVFMRNTGAKYNSVIMLLHGPEDKLNISTMDYFKEKVQTPGVDFLLDSDRCFNIVFQMPRNKDISTAPSVFSTTLKGVSVCLDPCLYEWLEYSPAPTSLNPVEVGIKTPTPEVLVDICSKESAPSSSHMSAPTGSQTISCSTHPLDKDAEGGITDPNDWTQFCISMYNILKRLIVQVEWDSCTIYCPISTLVSQQLTSNISRSIHRAFVAGNIPGLFVINLPQISLYNGTHKSPLGAVAKDVPITKLDGWNFGADLFPWTCTLTSCSIYSLHKTKEMLWCLKPCSVAATVALSTKYTPAASDNLSQLSLCVHADMEPLTLSLSDKQVAAALPVLQNMLELLSDNSPHSKNGKLSYFLPRPGRSTNPSSLPVGNIATTLSQIGIQVGDKAAAVLMETVSQKKNHGKVQEEHKPKLSLWLQWTLPKLTINLFSLNKDIGTRLMLDVEEIIVSVDIQGVYSKMKMKVAAINCNHYQKLHKNSSWEPGPFQGIIFCCSDKLSRAIFMPNPKSGMIEPSSDLGFLDSPKMSDCAYSFLSMTFTRAQCRNVQRRWTHVVQENPSDFTELKASDLQSPKQRYINEVDLKIQSFDSVLWCPILLKGLTIIEPFVQLLTFGDSTISQPVPPVARSEDIWDLSKHFNNNVLPLLYLNIGTVRVFIPHMSSYEESRFYDSKQQATAFHESKYDANPFNITTNPDQCPSGKGIADTCIIQVGSIYITPQVDNPLTRIVLRSDIYNLAQHARIINIPGSEVEDRQYQIDITGVSLASGSWQDLIKHSNFEPASTLAKKLHTMGENPALEWNNKVFTPSDSTDDTEVVFLPIVSKFDIRILLAPAILYQHCKESGKTVEEILVCGHSFEVNVLTDMDVYISLQQVTLFHQLLSNNLCCLTVSNDCEKSVTKCTQTEVSDGIPPSQREVRPDSGIESDISTFKAAVYDIPVSSAINLQPGIVTGKDMKAVGTLEKAKTTFLPCEVLLTAGSISIMLYSYEHRKRDKGSKSAHLRKKKTKHRPAELHTMSNSCGNKALRKDIDEKCQETLSTSSSPVLQLHPERRNSKVHSLRTRVKLPLQIQDGYEGSEEESVDDYPSAVPQCDSSDVLAEYEIIPVLHFIFCEPHTFLRCLYVSQKLEVSFFDIAIRGAHDSAAFLVTEGKQLPLSDDYTVSWLETKPGEANSKTGIRPALGTLTISNFLIGPADIKLKICRPLKLCLSIQKYKQILDLLEDVKKAVNPSTEKDIPVPVVAGIPSSGIKESSTDNLTELVRNSSKFVRCVHFSTLQFVATLETIPHRDNAFILFGLSEASGDIEFKTDKDGVANEIVLSTTVESYVLKTSYYNKLRSFIGPATTSVTINATWESWSTISPLPLICCSVDTEVLFVHIGREHMMCLEKLIDHLKNFQQNTIRTNDAMIPSSTPTENKKSCSKKTVVHKQSWHDDLRIGTFQYIQDADDIGIQPGPYEIVFCKEQVGQPASMTWCYPQPRALTRAEIYPVPFRTASDAGGQMNCDAREEVSCVLQFWDPLQRCFVTYKGFQLSEIQHCTLEIPDVSLDTNSQRTVSRRWRVVLDFSEGDEDLEEIVVRRSIVSPLALAACMRVDSYFEPDLIPCVQARFSFDLIQVSLSNHFQHLGKATPTILQPFVFDGIIPYDQDFLTISLQNTCVLGSHWNSNVKLNMQVHTSLGLEVVEYRNLTTQPVIEPFALQSRLSILKETETPAVVDATVVVEPMFLRLGQGVVHTLNVAAQAWNQPAEKSSEQLLMNYYVICNDTQETIRFGQVDMDESIVLHSRQMHSYSWRSQKTKQVLHVCVEGMRWKWCEPFSIDTVGTIVRTMDQKGMRATLVIKVRQLNNVQKQVIICGQLLMANRLDQHLEVMLILHDTDKVASEKSVIVGQQMCASSCVVDPSSVHCFRVRFMGINTSWSSDVMVSSGSKMDTKLIEVPLKDKGQFIHVWYHSFTQEIQSTTQQLILFTPLYIVQTHLPQSLNMIISTPGLNQTQVVEVEGKGYEYHLHCTGGVDVTHQLAFQLGPGLESSKPPLPLSVNMISQVTKIPSPSNVDLEELCLSWMSRHSLTWPYCDEEREDEVKSWPFGVLESVKRSRHERSPTTTILDQPNIELEVCLVQRWPFCNTLLVDVRPWGLVTNSLLVELVLRSSSGEDWIILPGETFATPKLKDFIYLGLRFDEQTFFSERFAVTNEDWSLRRYWQRSTDLPRQGCIQCSIAVVDETQTMQCCLTIEAKERHGIRVFHVQCTYNIINQTDKDFKLASCAVSKDCDKVEFMPESSVTVEVKKQTTSEEVSIALPVLMWEIFQPDASWNVASEESIKYISMCHSEQGKKPSGWSLPCHLQVQSPPSQHTMCIPVYDDDESLFRLATKPYLLSSYEVNHVIYLVITQDHSPQMVLRNNCEVPLHFGQGNHNSSEDSPVYEEMEALYRLPLILPNTSCHYTFPYVSKMFPELYELRTIPKLHLARASSVIGESGDHCDEIESVCWSGGVDITASTNLFLNIPDYSDVKIQLERTRSTMYITIDPVSRIEVSAKEIRSRIRFRDESSVVASTGKMHRFPSHQKLSSEQTQNYSLVSHQIPSGEHKAALNSAKQDDHVPCSLENSGADTQCPASPIAPLQHNSVVHQEVLPTSLLYLSTILKQVSIIVVDEISQPSTLKEIVCFSFDYGSLVLRPKSSSSSRNKLRKQYTKQEILLCVGNIQIDNQLQPEGMHDFPVVLVQQTPYQIPVFPCKPAVDIMLQAVRSNAFLTVDILLEIDDYSGLFYFENISVTAKPMMLYFEDSLLYKLLEIVPSFTPSCALSVIIFTQTNDNKPAPKYVTAATSVLHSPIRIENLTIQPVALLLSVRASLKLYISLDHTPLMFKQFQRRNITTTSYRLGQALTAHYISGALFRAGWVVGSLDLIGNPGGFARAVGSGMADFFLLPYQGLVRGPWSFLAGIVHGSSSLMRQITAGSLMSVTNLATSVSRNMELLSLDEEYRQQNEESRRHKPVNLGHGLAQGLTGFGISLLGAVAGIVDQPLQCLQHAVEQQNFPATAAVTGLLSGVSKGLVGVVAKPIGGAAEFVAQTGQGLLHGTGWSKILLPRHKSLHESASAYANSHLKFVWKMLPDLPYVDVLFALEATQINQTDHYVASVLLLTSQVLFIVGIDEDMQQQAFSLTEVDCHSYLADPTLIYLVPKQRQGSKSPQPEEHNQDRITDFVNKAAKYVAMQGQEENESHSDSSSQQSPPVFNLAATSLRLYVNPSLRNTFLSLFITAQRNAVGKGFSV